MIRKNVKGLMQKIGLFLIKGEIKMKNFIVAAKSAAKSLNIIISNYTDIAMRYYQQCELHERKLKLKKSCVTQV